MFVFLFPVDIFSTSTEEKNQCERRDIHFGARERDNEISPPVQSTTEIAPHASTANTRTHTQRLLALL